MMRESLRGWKLASHEQCCSANACVLAQLWCTAFLARPSGLKQEVMRTLDGRITLPLSPVLAASFRTVINSKTAQSSAHSSCFKRRGMII